MIFNDQEHRLLLAAISREKKVCKESGYDDLVKVCKSLENKVYDIQHKYQWHDLKKNPEDLPRTEEPVIATIKFCGKGSEYMKPICYTEGVYELFFKRWNLDEDHKWHDEYNSYVSYEVLAWRYIEPFEERGTE